MDDASGESMEPMEEVSLEKLGESKLERLVRMVDGEKPGVGSIDDGNYNGRNDLFFFPVTECCHVVDTSPERAVTG